MITVNIIETKYKISLVSFDMWLITMKNKHVVKQLLRKIYNFYTELNISITTIMKIFDTMLYFFTFGVVTITILYDFGKH